METVAEPLLTIVIPCRAEDEVAVQLCQRCLKVLGDNCDHDVLLSKVEVILVDDASPVAGLDTLDHANIANFRFVRNENRRGNGGSRNVGLAMATGRYVHYLDADDYVANDYLTHLLRHIEDDADKDIQMYLLGFIITHRDSEGKVVGAPKNPDGYDGFVNAPVSSCCKVVRRDRCVPHPEVTYLEDVGHCYRQMDAIDGKDNVRNLADIAYFCYDNTREGAFTRTSDFLAANHFTMEQLVTQDILPKNGYKDGAVSDLLRAVAELYDLRNGIVHAEVRNACIIRLGRIWNHILTNRFTH